MKKKVIIVQSFCDSCKKEHAWNACFRCGKDVCSDCRTRYGREIYFDSSEDPCACPECAKIIEKDPSQLGPLFDIVKLKNELNGFHADFKNRQKQAEDKCKGYTPQPAKGNK